MIPERMLVTHDLVLLSPMAHTEPSDPFTFENLIIAGRAMTLIL